MDIMNPFESLLLASDYEMRVMELERKYNDSDNNNQQLQQQLVVAAPNTRASRVVLMETVPASIWMLIFSFLSMSDLRVIAQVNNAWCQITRSLRGLKPSPRPLALNNKVDATTTTAAPNMSQKRARMSPKGLLLPQVPADNAAVKRKSFDVNADSPEDSEGSPFQRARRNSFPIFEKKAFAHYKMAAKANSSPSNTPTEASSGNPPFSALKTQMRMQIEISFKQLEQQEAKQQQKVIKNQTEDDDEDVKFSAENKATKKQRLTRRRASVVHASTDDEHEEEQEFNRFLQKQASKRKQSQLQKQQQQLQQQQQRQKQQDDDYEPEMHDDDEDFDSEQGDDEYETNSYVEEEDEEEDFKLYKKRTDRKRTDRKRKTMKEKTPSPTTKRSGGYGSGNNSSGDERKTRKMKLRKNTTWLYIVCDAARRLTLEKLERQRQGEALEDKECNFFTNRELCNFIDLNWDIVCQGKKRTSTYRHTISRELSTNPSLFRSGYQEYHEYGYWALRSLDF